MRRNYGQSIIITFFNVFLSTKATPKQNVKISPSFPHTHIQHAHKQISLYFVSLHIHICYLNVLLCIGLFLFSVFLLLLKFFWIFSSTNSSFQLCFFLQKFISFLALCLHINFVVGIVVANIQVSLFYCVCILQFVFVHNKWCTAVYCEWLNTIFYIALVVPFTHILAIITNFYLPLINLCSIYFWIVFPLSWRRRGLLKAVFIFVGKIIWPNLFVYLQMVNDTQSCSFVRTPLAYVVGHVVVVLCSMFALGYLLCSSALFLHFFIYCFSLLRCVL